MKTEWVRNKNGRYEYLIDDAKIESAFIVRVRTKWIAYYWHEGLNQCAPCATLKQAKEIAEVFVCTKSAIVKAALASMGMSVVDIKLTPVIFDDLRGLPTLGD